MANAEHYFSLTVSLLLLVILPFGSADWGPWGDWSGCSRSCGTGTQVRWKTCPAGANCPGGPPGDIQACNTQSCPIDGNWGIWGPWPECPVTCGSTNITRLRLCNSPTPQHGGRNCSGPDTETAECNQGPCPVEWGPWGNWSDCSRSCGLGIQMRRRTCPTGAFCGAGNAPGDIQLCNERSCGINGNWGTWGPWSECLVTCGSSDRTRHRLCNSPAPAYGGLPCQGTDTEREICDAGPCPVHGQWGPWGEFSECSATCGVRVTKTRRRECNDPAPAHGGRPCQGLDQDVVVCTHIPRCPINGGWSDWTRWTPCSHTCGNNGSKRRLRRCNRPQPQYGGLLCAGESLQQRRCEMPNPCPIHGGWSDWAEWTDCAANSCHEEGLRFRSRQCNNPPPLYDGQPCRGSSTDNEPCRKEGCPRDGGWSEWGEWEECSPTCGASGFRERRRQCDNPPPLNRGRKCRGPRIMRERCEDLDPCPGASIGSSVPMEIIATTTNTETDDSSASSSAGSIEETPTPEVSSEIPTAAGFSSSSSSDSSDSSVSISPTDGGPGAASSSSSLPTTTEELTTWSVSSSDSAYY